MKSLISCQNEDSRGLSSASRLTALSSSSRAARCAARFVSTGVRKSRILSSAVSSLFACNSDDRARNRKASMHVSRRVLMTSSMTHTPHASIIYASKFFSQNLRTLPSLHGVCRCASPPPPSCSTGKSWLHFRPPPVDFCCSRLAICAATERARACRRERAPKPYCFTAGRLPRLARKVHWPALAALHSLRSARKKSPGRHRL